MPSDDFTNLRLSPSFELELKVDAGAGRDTGVIEGVASAFGPPADSYGDIISPTAFDRTLAEHKARGTMPAALWAHEPAQVVGRWTSMTEDPEALRVVGKVNLKTASGRDAWEHLLAQDVRGLSVGYKVAPGGRIPNGDGSAMLIDVDLFEVSLTALPSNKRARLTGVKMETRAELVQLIHEGGLPRAAAQKVALGGWAALSGQGDVCAYCGDDEGKRGPLLKGLAASICTSCIDEAAQRATYQQIDMKAVAARIEEHRLELKQLRNERN